METKPLLHIWLIRHGITSWNETGKCLGITDVPLSPAGRESAKVLGQHLDLNSCQAIYSSPAKRALETAAILLDKSEQKLVVRHELKEIDFGAWEGKTWHEIQKSSNKEWHAWERNPLRCAPYGGESLGEVSLRMMALYDHILMKHRGQTVVFIGHGGSLNAFLCNLFHISLGVIWAFRMLPASFSEIVIYAHGPTITILNYSPYYSIGASGSTTIVRNVLISNPLKPQPQVRFETDRGFF